MGQTIRPADTRDAHAIARIHVAGWQHGYRGLIEQAYLDSLTVEEREHRWVDILSGSARVLVHGDADHVDAFITFGPSRDDDVSRAAGEIYGLYVHPEAWGRGVGASVLTAAVSALRSEQGVSTTHTAQRSPGLRASAEPTEAPLVLWTLEGNRRARRFYQRQGWLADGTRKQQHRPGVAEAPGITFTEVRYLLPPWG